MSMAYKEKKRGVSSRRDTRIRKPHRKKSREPLLDNLKPRDPSSRSKRKSISYSPVQLKLPMISLSEKSTLDAYAIPRAFEKQQLSNGHLSAEANIIGLLSRFIGRRIVSLPCGSGWLDREIVRRSEKSLYAGEELKIFGIDMSPESVDIAKHEMGRMVERNYLLRKCMDEGRFGFDYQVARLGSQIATDGKNGKPLIIPSFSQIDLSSTCIGAHSPDTFIAFMALALWVDERENAIMSIAEKCHKKDGFDDEPTYVINGEEYPTRITPSIFMEKDFENAVEEKKRREVSPNEMWASMFSKFGLHKETCGRVEFSTREENHTMHYAAFKYVGGTNWNQSSPIESAPR